MIRKPDFWGKSKWVFSFQGRNLSITIEDKNWLAKFQASEIDIRHGDALRVKISEIDYYDANGEVIKIDRAIEKIINVIRRKTRVSLFYS